MLDISDIMTPRQNLVVVQPDATVDDVRRIMAEHRIRHVPVLDASGALLGLVARTDVLLAGSDGPRQVHEVMVHDLDTVDERSNVRNAAVLMLQRKRSCLPVIRDGELRGLVTDADFLGVAITLMEQLESVEPEPDEGDIPNEH
ncbi:CBS domain-containing protein [Thioalkalivibrio paradoxus]|uniref:Acetoin utilization protein AcuB n=1 Tax=Thioalkalivibrio paradoxus ARh 1 TaxID=713585 RepID=W0DJL6_9GAMM|nr:CBS domain-containing protein [Thioalkalivibrio paradoxus]AHE97437.1 acetoin utilization protein AcuB [Thioalkalivibrio paradoxus ARh 1]